MNNFGFVIELQDKTVFLFYNKDQALAKMVELVDSNTPFTYSFQLFAKPESSYEYNDDD